MPPSSSKAFEPSTRQGTFHTTHWTVVLAAQDLSHQTAARKALEELCTIYWPPLYSFIRRHGFSPHEAEDMTQDFFSHLLEHEALRQVAPANGRFRSFLLACVKNFLGQARERACAQRRGGGRPLISLENMSAEKNYLLEPADTATPEVFFERRWAFTVLAETLRELEKDYGRRGQGAVFNALKGELPGTVSGGSRPEAAAVLGMRAGAVDVAVHRLRQRFAAILREQVAQTVSSENEVDEELRYLMSLVGNSA
jgi:RNA polymerase sigma-70 factor (ECF subfamily)